MRSLIYINCRLLFFTGMLFSISGILTAQDPNQVSDFRQKITPMILAYELEKALDICNTSVGSDREVLAAKSVIYSLLGNMEKDDKLMEKGFKLLEPYSSYLEDFNIQVAFAISYSVQANHSGLNKKAALSQSSIRHCKNALRLNPMLAHPNFILGRFYFELSGMSAAVTKVAGNLIDEEELNRASYKLAVSFLEEASRLAPDRFLYNYYTGEAYNKLGNKEMALLYFWKADGNIRHTADDKKASKALAKELK